MSSEAPKRYELDTVKSLAIQEAERAQNATQHFINQLTIRSSEIQKQVDKLEAKASQLKTKIAELNKIAHEAKETADEAYKKTITEIISTFDVAIPFKAKTVYSGGLPVAIDVEKSDKDLIVAEGAEITNG